MLQSIKRLIIILLVILLIPNLTACKSKKVSEENMVKVMLDGFLTYAYLQQYNAEPILIQNKSFMRDSIYPKILNHYKVDTSDFYNTLNYYEQNPTEYQKLLKIVQDSIHQIDSVLLAKGKVQAIDTTIKKIVEPITNDSILQQKSQEYLEQFKENRKKIKRPKN